MGEYNPPSGGGLPHKASHQNGGGDEVSVAALSGLLADDQHVLDAEVIGVAIAISLLTTRGDIIYRNATVPARLAKGSSGQVLTMGADDPEWAATPASKTIATGTYSGNGSAGRQITTGFKCSMVIIHCANPGVSNLVMQVLIPNGAAVHKYINTGYQHTPVSEDSLHATNGFVVDTNTANAANVSGKTYYYWAISE